MKDTRLKIGLDVDDVLADFIGTFKTYLEKVTGRRLEGEPGSWDFVNWKVSKQEIDAAWRLVDSVNNFWMTLDTCRDIKLEHLWQLDRKNNLFFITSRDFTKGMPVEVQTACWLESIGFVKPTVIVTKNKGSIVAALKLDAFIDDRFKNIEDIWYNDTGVGTKLFLRNRSHNQNIDPDFEYDILFQRVDSFEEFAKLYV